MLNDDQRLAADRPDYQHVTPQEWGCLYESMRSPSLYQFWRTYTYLMPQAEWVGAVPKPSLPHPLAQTEAGAASHEARTTAQTVASRG